MLLDEKRAEAADAWYVGWARTPDDGPRLGLGLDVFAPQGYARF
jgi:hypothetical protein